MISRVMDILYELFHVILLSLLLIGQLNVRTLLFDLVIFLMLPFGLQLL